MIKLMGRGWGITTTILGDLFQSISRQDVWYVHGKYLHQCHLHVIIAVTCQYFTNDYTKYFSSVSNLSLKIADLKWTSLIHYDFITVGNHASTIWEARKWAKKLPFFTGTHWPWFSSWMSCRLDIWSHLLDNSKIKICRH